MRGGEAGGVEARGGSARREGHAHGGGEGGRRTWRVRKEG